MELSKKKKTNGLLSDDEHIEVRIFIFFLIYSKINKKKMLLKKVIQTIPYQ